MGQWLSWWLSCKESTCNAGDVASIFGLGRSLDVGNGNPLQYSWENSMDRGAWEAAIHGVTESGIAEHAYTGNYIQYFIITYNGK